MKKDKIIKIIKELSKIILISLLIEILLVFYNFLINKVFEKMHFINNESVFIERDKINVKENNGNYYLEVNNLANKKIYNVSLKLNEDNKDVYLRILYNNDAKFMPKENAKANKFKVYFISGLETNKINITYPKEQIKLDNISKIIINDNIDYMPVENISLEQILIIFLTILFVCILIKFYKYSEDKKKTKKEFIFLGLSLVIGLIFIFINVPQIRYDEHAHFWRAYEISQGHFISKTTNELPNSVIGLFEGKNGDYPNREFNYETVKEKICEKLNPESTRSFAVGATGSLTVISYIPQVIGVTIGRLLRLSPIIILWLGRLTNLLVYIILIYIAIKIMPSNKWKSIIMLIALFPMSMNLSTTLSPDAIIISVTLLAISYIMYLKFTAKQIKLKNIILLGILCMIPTVCKIVYFPLCLLVLLLPNEKFENKTKRFISYALILLLVFVPYIVLNKINALGDCAIAIRSNMLEQCLFTISDISRDFAVAINTMYSEFSKYFFEMIGGWNTVELISIIIFIILVIEIFRDNENPQEKKYKFTKKEIIICTIICLIEILGITAAMYLGWTQAKQMVVEGIQGRYFLPTIPIICIMLSKNKFKMKINNKDTKYIIIMIILYLIIFGYSIKYYL